MSKSPDTRCGNCKHFVVGGFCELVQGKINVKDTCDFFEDGNPKPMDTAVNPNYTKCQSNYRIKIAETVIGDIIQKAIQMEHTLLDRGVPAEEVHRAVIAYFSEPEPPYAKPWPPEITGLDLAAPIEPVKVPDTGTPLTDFTGLPKDTQPFPTPNKSPYGIGTTSEPYPSFLTPDSNSKGSQSNAYEIKNNPASPSDNWVGVASDVNSEPSMHGEYGHVSDLKIPPIPDDFESLHSDKRINSRGIEPSGAREIQEAISSLRSEFEWLSEDYVVRAKKLLDETGGSLYLIRAASESLTDHTQEGEPYRRKLSAEELSSMTRTSIGKKIDINHDPNYETDSTVLDAEFDTSRKEIQMLVLERNRQIIDAIDNDTISAVSINGGMPRSEDIEPCDHNCTSNCELCVVPKGVVLGELDGIALTYVVTHPNGLYWNGNFIPKATPGIKTTRLEKL